VTTFDDRIDGAFLPAWDDPADRTDFRAERRRGRRDRARRRLLKITGLILVLVAWEIGSWAVGDSVILPSVQTTAHTFVHYLNRPYPAASDPLWQDMVVSGRRILVGFVIGVAGGVLLGSAMWSWRSLRAVIDPVVEVTRPLPPLAFIPLLIVWFGIGELPKFVLIVIGVVPIMIVSTVAALDNTPRELAECARTLGASRLYTLWHVQIRAALPGIITGMRLAMGAAWASIVAVEMIAATSGIGFLILQAGNYLRTDLVMSGIIAIAVVGILFDTVLRGLTRIADPSRAVVG
jgi:NitT/TauT family transport system permease protein/taurine transport system permease protein